MLPKLRLLSLASLLPTLATAQQLQATQAPQERQVGPGAAYFYRQVADTGSSRGLYLPAGTRTHVVGAFSPRWAIVQHQGYRYLVPTAQLAVAVPLPPPLVTLPVRGALDTAGYWKGGYNKLYDHFYWGTLTLRDGTVVNAYLPANRLSYERIIDYFPQPPVPNKLVNGRTTVKMPDIQSMTVHGRHYEVIPAKGHNTKFMALLLQQGPVDLLVYSQPRSILLLAAGPTTITAIPIKDKPYWIVRRGGVWRILPRGKAFAPAMSAYLSDAPELAAKVAARMAGYEYSNAPAIIREYNQRAPVEGTAKP